MPFTLTPHPEPAARLDAEKLEVYAVVNACEILGFSFDLVHAHDWHTALLPLYLQSGLRGSVPFRDTRSVYTIHNLMHQGKSPRHLVYYLGICQQSLVEERNGEVNFMARGIYHATMINTVSPTYAREIQTPYYGCGLQGVLGARRNQLHGIVNGVDYQRWDPATDHHLPANYDVDSVAERKPVCKAALQKHFGLPEQPRTPVLGMIARLVEQKGVDLVIRAAEGLLAQDTQLVVLGEGDPVYHRALEKLRGQHRDRVGLLLGFDSKLAHRIEAGADLFLMPSMYEPCGLNQL